MKIVQINAVYGYSSTGRTSRELHEQLLSKGFDSYVFCANTIRCDNNVFLIGNTLDQKIHSFGSHLLGLQGYFSSLSTKRMLKKLKSIEPDVVILRNLHSNYVNVPLLLRFLADENLATIVVLHDVWPFTGHCCYYTEDKCTKWMTECDKCPILHKYNSSWLFDHSRKQFKDKNRLFHKINKLAVVGVSSWVTEEAKKSPIFSNAKVIERIYNWIDLDVFKPRKTADLRESLNIAPDDFVVLGIAQKWNERKGYSQYVELAKNCQDIKVVIVGQNNDENVLPSNMICVPPTNSTEELARFYSMADVYLNFSNQETFGKVSAEALSCGTPIIAFNSTANPELCGDGCGYVFNERNWKEVLPLINKVKANGKAFYSQNCLNFSKAHFSKDSNINDYLQLFGQL